MKYAVFVPTDQTISYLVFHNFSMDEIKTLQIMESEEFFFWTTSHKEAVLLTKSQLDMIKGVLPEDATIEPVENVRMFRGREDTW